MGGECVGICKEYVALRPERGGRYIKGQKRCNVCSLFIKCDGFRCPCCRSTLRLKPRKRQLREKHNEALGIMRL